MALLLIGPHPWRAAGRPFPRAAPTAAGWQLPRLQPLLPPCWLRQMAAAEVETNMNGSNGGVKGYVHFSLEVEPNTNGATAHALSTADSATAADKAFLSWNTSRRATPRHLLLHEGPQLQVRGCLRTGGLQTQPPEWLWSLGMVAGIRTSDGIELVYEDDGGCRQPGACKSRAQQRLPLWRGMFPGSDVWLACASGT